MSDLIAITIRFGFNVLNIQSKNKKDMQISGMSCCTYHFARKDMCNMAWFYIFQNTVAGCIRLLRSWKGVPVSHTPLIILNKIPKINMANMQISPKFRKHCILISPKLIQVPRIPINIYKYIPYPFYFGQYPCIPKTLPGPHCFY